jgi:hypothetical protein
MVDAPLALWRRLRERRSSGLGAVEAALAELEQQQVGRDHQCDGDEEVDGEGGETERVRER